MGMTMLNMIPRLGRGESGGRGRGDDVAAAFDLGKAGGLRVEASLPRLL